MKTRQLLQDQSLLKYALEVDIGSHSHILFELAPRVVPTLILVSNDGTIVYVKEGLIHPEEAGKLFEVITQNFSSFIRE